MLAKTPQETEFPEIRSFAERIERLLERVQYRRAETESELDAILRLRYDAYLREGAISPSEAGRLEDSFDEGDNVYNFGVFVDGELASALRLHVLSEPHHCSPALESFGDVLQPLLAAGNVVIDPNRFVANYKVARQHPELPYVTLRPACVASEFFDVDLVTMTVRAEHQAFYRRGLFARPVCPARPYPLLSKPISLLLIDFANDRQRILARHPYWASSGSERQTLFGPGPTWAHARAGQEVAV